MARIHHMMRNLRQSLGRDHQDFGPVFGQCAGGDRSCEDAREIERLDTRERPVAGSEGLWFAVCNFDDLDDRFRGECLSMWMGHPLGICPNHGAAGTGLVDRGFKIYCIPVGDGGCNGFRVGIAAKDIQNACPQVGQPEMRQEPPAILGWPGLGDSSHVVVLVERDRFERAIAVRLLHVAGASKGCCCVAHVDCNVLATTGSDFPDVGNGGANSCQDCGACFANFEFRREDRVRSSNLYLVRSRHTLIPDAHNLFECGRH